MSEKNTPPNQPRLRVVKGLSSTPVVAVCTHCNREFKAPMSALSRTVDAQANLQPFSSNLTDTNARLRMRYEIRGAFAKARGIWRLGSESSCTKSGAWQSRPLPMPEECGKMGHQRSRSHLRLGALEREIVTLSASASLPCFGIPAFKAM
jgi:hypothetical protein